MNGFSLQRTPVVCVPCLTFTRILLVSCVAVGRGGGRGGGGDRSVGKGNS